MRKIIAVLMLIGLAACSKPTSQPVEKLTSALAQATPTPVIAQTLDIPGWPYLGSAIAGTPEAIDGSVYDMEAFQKSKVLVAVSLKGRLYVRLYNGSWSTVGSNLNRTRTSSAMNPQLAVRNDLVFLTWKECEPLSTKCDVWVRQWDGINWNWVGGAVSDGAHGSKPDIAIHPKGIPFVAYSEGDLDTEGILKVKYFKSASSGWVQLGGNLNQDGQPTVGKLTVTDNGSVFVGQNDKDNRVFVQKYSAGAWSVIPSVYGNQWNEFVGGFSMIDISPNEANEPSISYYMGRLGNSYFPVQGLVGGVFTDFGYGDFSSRSGASGAYDTLGVLKVFASAKYMGAANHNDVTVIRPNPVDFEEITPRLDVVTTNLSLDPVVRFDSAARVVVAWVEEDASGLRHINVRRSSASDPH